MMYIQRSFVACKSRICEHGLKRLSLTGVICFGRKPCRYAFIK